jgi:hypothetical protein
MMPGFSGSNSGTWETTSQPTGLSVPYSLQFDIGPTNSYAEAMEVELTADQRAFANQAIQAGRLQREEEVVAEALALWEARERVRAEIFASVDAAEASLSHGKGRIVTEQSMRDLASEVKQHGRARLAAEQNAAF